MLIPDADQQSLNFTNLEIQIRIFKNLKIRKTKEEGGVDLYKIVANITPGKKAVEVKIIVRKYHALVVLVSIQIYSTAGKTYLRETAALFLSRRFESMKFQISCVFEAKCTKFRILPSRSVKLKIMRNRSESKINLRMRGKVVQD